MAWVSGALLSAAATLVAAYGDNLIKRSYSIMTQEGLSTDGRWEWSNKNSYIYVNGMFIFGWFFNAILNSVLNALGLNLAPASLVMPLAALHIAFNVPLARCLNDERITHNALLCTGIVVLGNLMVVIAGPKHDESFETPSEATPH